MKDIGYECQFSPWQQCGAMTTVSHHGNNAASWQQCATMATMCHHGNYMAPWQQCPVGIATLVTLKSQYFINLNLFFHIHFTTKSQGTNIRPWLFLIFLISLVAMATLCSIIFVVVIVVLIFVFLIMAVTLLLIWI